jgi:coenzyme PQQ precursor peptide PqqA
MCSAICAQENHEASFTSGARLRVCGRRTISLNHGASPCRQANNEEIHMNWTTPKATDLRFGFEITMYVANR